MAKKHKVPAELAALGFEHIRSVSSGEVSSEKEVMMEVLAPQDREDDAEDNAEDSAKPEE